MIEAGKRVCLIPKLSGVSGMVSFQNRLADGLGRRRIQVFYELSDRPYEAVLVIGGTRNLEGFRRARQKGVKIYQRLDGMNWLQRVRWTGVRHFLRAEYGNIILSFIRSRLADGVIYQSKFAQAWWERAHGSLSMPAWVVYNGVDLDLFSPDGSNERPVDRYRILLVEGRLGGGYESGIEMAVQLAAGLQQDRRQDIEVMIVGRVDKTIVDRWQREAQVSLRFAGVVPQSFIPAIDRSAHLLYSADINAACPNSVIEAMACGLPVVGFDTGAIPELVNNQEAGRVVPYGGNPWNLDPPDSKALSRAAQEILLERERYSAGARARAEAIFGLDRMVEGYLQALSGG